MVPTKLLKVQPLIDLTNLRQQEHLHFSNWKMASEMSVFLPVSLEKPDSVDHKFSFDFSIFQYPSYQ